MNSKKYIIGGLEFTLKDYGELNGFEEEEIEKLLTPGEPAGSYDIFPVILLPPAGTDIKQFDWRSLTNKQVAAILVDFIIEKKSFQESVRSFITESIKQNLQPSVSLNQNSVP